MKLFWHTSFWTKHWVKLLHVSLHFSWNLHGSFFRTIKDEKGFFLPDNNIIIIVHIGYITAAAVQLIKTAGYDVTGASSCAVTCFGNVNLESLPRMHSLKCFPANGQKKIKHPEYRCLFLLLHVTLNVSRDAAGYGESRAEQKQILASDCDTWNSFGCIFNQIQTVNFSPENFTWMSAVPNTGKDRAESESSWRGGTIQTFTTVGASSDFEGVNDLDLKDPAEKELEW